jgi:hypothetical protein
MTKSHGLTREAEHLVGIVHPGPICFAAPNENTAVYVEAEKKSRPVEGCAIVMAPVVFTRFDHLGSPVLILVVLRTKRSDCRDHQVQEEQFPHGADNPKCSLPPVRIASYCAV